MWRDCETELDFLDFDYLINALTALIKNDELLPSSVGVYGDWGSGKSSLIHMSVKELEKDEGTVCITFNGWLFEGYEDAKTAILGSILDEIKEKRKPVDKALICLKGLYKSVDKLKLIKYGVKYGAAFLGTGGLGVLASMSFDSLADSISGIEDSGQIEKSKTAISDELNNAKLREDIREFQDEFVSLLEKTKITRLVVFIDELDRCNPDTILDTLEAIRLFVFKGNVSFIICADERHIQYAVKRKFPEIEGIGFNIGKEYLEKLIQYPVKIPRLGERETKVYIACLFLQKALSKEDFNKLISAIAEKKKTSLGGFDFEYSDICKMLSRSENWEGSESVKDCVYIANQIGRILAIGFNGNPRQCKRFLNSLIMRENMAAFKQVTLSRSILAKIMLLEYFKSQAFRKCAELQATKKFNEELTLAENGKMGDCASLSLWQSDEWFCSWIMSYPKLADIDLIPYFYVARDALVNRLSTTSSQLSPVATEVLQKLQSKSDYSISQALKSSSEISEVEANAILEQLYSSLNSGDEMDGAAFKAFIQWGESRTDLHAETLSLLKQIPANRLKAANAPFIGKFAKTANQQSQIKDWIEGTKFEETTVHKAFGAMLGTFKV